MDHLNANIVLKMLKMLIQISSNEGVDGFVRGKNVRGRDMKDVHISEMMRQRHEDRKGHCL